MRPDSPAFGAWIRMPKSLGAARTAALLTLFAGILRFSFLDAGLRHEPHPDEGVFVREAQAMIQRGDWVPRFFEYPGLLLWIFKALIMTTGASGAEAFLVARAFVAFAASAAVFVVAYFGTRWDSTRTGVLAGLLVALSPICVFTAHSIRPDAVIHVLIVLALALGAPLNGPAHGPAAWVTGAVATAIKFSAALVFPVLLLAACIDGTRWAAVLRLAGLAGATFFVLSPFTLLEGPESLSGMLAQLGYHFAKGASGVLPSLWQHLTHTLPLALSWPGIALASIGVGLSLRTARGAVWVSFIVLWVIVFSSTEVSFIRFMVPVLGALSLLAASAFSSLYERARGGYRAGLAVLVIAALAISASEVVADLRALGRPSPRDLALDWIESNPGLSHVGFTGTGLGYFSPASSHIVEIGAAPLNPIWLTHLDAVVTDAEAKAPKGFVVASRFAGNAASGERGLAVYVNREPPRILPLPVERPALTSSAPDRVDRLLDPSLRTRWRSDMSPAFIDVALPGEASLSRIELVYGPISRGKDQVTRVVLDGKHVPFVRLRGPVDRQRRDRTPTELLAFEPSRTRSVRLEFAGEPPFIASVLRLYAQAP